MSQDAGHSADLFISYARTDQAWAEWIAWQLEEAGYRILVQAWDFAPGADFIRQMAEGVQSAERTIAVISPAYLDSVFAQEEWGAAWARDPIGEQGKLIPIRIAEADPPGPLAGLVRLDLFGLSEPVARSRLLAAMRLIVGARERPVSNPEFPSAGNPFPAVLPSVWNVPPRPLSFTGRDAILDDLTTHFARSGSLVVQTIHGPGGIGKSQTALEFAHRHAADYDTVWWVAAENFARIPDQLAMLASELYELPPLNAVDKLAAVRRALRSRGRWLIIFDDVAANPTELGTVLPEGPGHILITTRDNGFEVLGRVVELGVLSRQESQALLTRHLQIDYTDANLLADALGDLPLALTIAAGYINQRQITAQEYMELLAGGAPDVLTRGLTERGSTEQSIGAVLSWSLELLRTSRPIAFQVLEICAWLSAEPIPIEVFTENPGRLPAPLAARAADPLLSRRHLRNLSMPASRGV